MRQIVTKITTDDTHKTYEFPGDNNPQIWEIEICVRAINKENGQSTGKWGNTVRLHVEQQSLNQIGYKEQQTDQN